MEPEKTFAPLRSSSPVSYDVGHAVIDQIFDDLSNSIGSPSRRAKLTHSESIESIKDMFESVDSSQNSKDSSSTASADELPLSPDLREIINQRKGIKPKPLLFQEDVNVFSKDSEQVSFKEQPPGDPSQVIPDPELEKKRVYLVVRRGELEKEGERVARMREELVQAENSYLKNTVAFEEKEKEFFEELAQFQGFPQTPKAKSPMLTTLDSLLNTPRASGSRAMDIDEPEGDPTSKEKLAKKRYRKIIPISDSSDEEELVIPIPQEKPSPTQPSPLKKKSKMMIRNEFIEDEAEMSGDSELHIDDMPDDEEDGTQMDSIITNESVDYTETQQIRYLQNSSPIKHLKKPMEEIINRNWDKYCEEKKKEAEEAGIYAEEDYERDSFCDDNVLYTQFGAFTQAMTAAREEVAKEEKLGLPPKKNLRSRAKKY